MNRRLWDLYAPIYKRAMKADQHIYEFMYKRIPDVIRDREVLELATGPGLLAKHIAPSAKKIIATDYSEGFFTPPYETEESLKKRLESMYSEVEVTAVEGIACFCSIDKVHILG